MYNCIHFVPKYIVKTVTLNKTYFFLVSFFFLNGVVEHGHLHKNSWLPLVKSPQVLQTPWLELSGNLLVKRLLLIE